MSDNIGRNMKYVFVDLKLQLLFDSKRKAERAFDDTARPPLFISHFQTRAPLTPHLNRDVLLGAVPVCVN